MNPRRPDPRDRRVTALFVLAMVALPAAVVFLVVPMLWDGTSSYVDRNRDILRALPVYPGATQAAVESHSYRLTESGPVVGYGTLATFDAPTVGVEELLAFYEANIGPGWHTYRESYPCIRLEDGFACPSMVFLRATRDREYVSIDPSNLTTPMGSYDVYVDHDSHLTEATPAVSPPPAPSPTPTFTPIVQ